MGLSFFYFLAFLEVLAFLAILAFSRGASYSGDSSFSSDSRRFKVTIFAEVGQRNGRKNPTPCVEGVGNGRVASSTRVV